MSNQVKLILFSIFLLWMFQFNLSKRIYTIDKIVHHNIEGCTNASFNVTQKNGNFVINAVIDVLKPLKKHMIQIQVFSLPVNSPRLTILNRTVNTCKMLKKKSSNDFIYVFFVSALKRHTNSTLTCPLAKGTYIFKNLQLNVNVLPSFFPVADQKILFHSRSYDLFSDGREETFLEVNATGTLKNK